MATDAAITGIQFERPEGDPCRELYGRPGYRTKDVDDRKRTMTITYEWYGVGIPSNLPEVVKNHLELVHINFGV